MLPPHKRVILQWLVCSARSLAGVRVPNQVLIYSCQ